MPRGLNGARMVCGLLATFDQEAIILLLIVGVVPVRLLQTRGQEGTQALRYHEDPNGSILLLPYRYMLKCFK